MVSPRGLRSMLWPFAATLALGCAEAETDDEGGGGASDGGSDQGGAALGGCGAGGDGVGAGAEASAHRETGTRAQVGAVCSEAHDSHPAARS